MKRFCLILLLVTAVSLMASPAIPAHATPARQEATPTPPPDLPAEAIRLWSQMGVAERVGQLFLVTFSGDQVLPESAIADLILNYHVGGVVLDRRNDNITGYGRPANAPTQVAILTNQLQSVALRGTPTFTATATINLDLLGENEDETGIPLLIALNQEGNGYPYSHLFNGLTETPSNMTVGATWRPGSAQSVGQVVGQELSSVGVNMLLGPVLDVLEKPANGANDLGVRSFGGDPYWVGLMGQAYTAGVHEGSHGRIAVIARHFPGFGASDRPLQEEIPTVQKSLADLERGELVPFVAVTGGASNVAQTVDGLLTTHIRYQGFQGNITAATNPVSLDPQALTTLLQRPGLSHWRQNGGVIVSDSLGARAIARFYDNTAQEFPHRVIAKDAFLAGNDLLYLDNFALNGAPYATQLANIQDTIRWFQERYETDAAFQAQVDTAVLRILQLKLRLYGGDFTPENVLLADTAVSPPTTHTTTMMDVTQNGLTLISPSADVLAERLRPPGPNEQIVIFTDLRQGQQCTTCPVQPLISLTAIQDRILALYGPQASGQARPEQITSYSFADLATFLAAGPEPIVYNAVPITPTLVPSLPEEELTPEAGTAVPFPTATPPPGYQVQQSLRAADWVIFALLADDARSQALNDFLAQRPDLARNQRLIVFAYNTPHFLDTTEISQITAYYALFSKTSAAIDASVRALYQELTPRGVSPVSIDAVGYNVAARTQPDPNQIIPLRYIADDQVIESTAEADPLPVSVGDSLRLQAGVIVDSNGNPVPDNTIVRFVEWDRVGGGRSILAEVPTRNGLAQWDYVLETRTEGGKFRIGVTAGNALISQELDITVSNNAQGEAQVRIIDPTPAPTNTPSPTATPSPTSTPTPSPTLTLTPTTLPLPPEAVEPVIQIELSELLTLVTMSVGLMFVAVTAVIGSRRLRLEPAQQVGWPLWGMVGGLMLYLYVLLELPGTAVFSNLGAWAGLASTLLGGLAGLVVYRVRASR
ncbi:MAG: glycoside hydrolase family 3 protein [Chloroflexi bacterium]|nr:glycoside hydrolase family 3 protein [Ardenticatenaceae bacterium]NOG34670.1 glycoside hydrolase family 3 protein [Chloroflexota bacterium]